MVGTTMATLVVSSRGPPAVTAIGSFLKRMGAATSGPPPLEVPARYPRRFTPQTGSFSTSDMRGGPPHAPRPAWVALRAGPSGGRARRDRGGEPHEAMPPHVAHLGL